jgi:hypothetical protein
VLAKSLGTTNPINMAKATIVALKELRRPEDVARIRGKQISEVLPFKTPPRVAAEPEAAVPAPAPAPVAAPVVVEEPVVAEPEPVVEAEPVAEPVAEAPAAEEKPKRRTIRKKKDA